MLNEQISPKQETGIRSIVLENEQQGSIHTIDDLRNWLEKRVERLLPHYDVITIPKGIVHESFFMERTGVQSMEPVISRVLNAQFHIHDKVCLVNSGTTRTPTMVAKQNSIAQATLESLQSRSMQGTISGALSNTVKGWSPRTVEECLENGLNVNGNGFILNALNGFYELMKHNSLQYSTMSGTRASPWQEESAYKLVRDIQSRTTEAANIEWKDMQIGIIPGNVWHGRSVLKSEERSKDERLSVIEGW